MTYNELCYCINDLLLTGHASGYVAGIKYKYKHEDAYSFSNEILSYDYSTSSVCWFNDWYEGQEDCELLYLYNIDYLVDFYRKAGETHD